MTAECLFLPEPHPAPWRRRSTYDSDYVLGEDVGALTREQAAVLERAARLPGRLYQQPDPAYLASPMGRHMYRGPDAWGRPCMMPLVYHTIPGDMQAGLGVTELECEALFATELVLLAHDMRIVDLSIDALVDSALVAVGREPRRWVDPEFMTEDEVSARLGISTMALGALDAADILPRRRAGRYDGHDYRTDAIKAIATEEARIDLTIALRERCRHLYVLEVVDVCTKIGITRRPLDRLAQHSYVARGFGRRLGRQWISVPHLQATENERALINFGGRRSEFLPKSFDEVMAFIEGLPIPFDPWEAPRPPRLFVRATCVLPAEIPSVPSRTDEAPHV